MGPTTVTAYRRKLATVEWRDLIKMRRRDGVVECLHPMPWLAASWIAADARLWPLAAIASFMFFLTALRLNHEAIHGNLGLGKTAHRWVLHGLSGLMLGSNNAVAFNHLRHHRHLGTAQDIEGDCGRMSFWQVLRDGPRFPLRMHLEAWHHGGPRLHRRMAIDLALNAILAGAAVLTLAPVLLYHVAAMIAAQCLTALFAVWITHHDCAEDEVARTQATPFVNLVTYNMFLHLEHHLFPAVPVRRLGILARRIAAAQPDLAAQARQVLPLAQVARIARRA
ncbi:fatty acid desaturase [Sphingomonas sp. PB4P5]|uniref:fatty acid desaturase n=1 Tax=Parasphingomonas puruogangriensis TaxID=3096155 RepID=UPI002FC66FDC